MSEEAAVIVFGWEKGEFRGSVIARRQFERWVDATAWAAKAAAAVEDVPGVKVTDVITHLGPASESRSDEELVRDALEEIEERRERERSSW